MNETVKQPLDLPFGAYEPQLSASIDLERYLSSEVLLHVFDLSGTHEVKTCYGDVVKIVNALRDYAKLLETVCDEWELGGFHRATYEYQAEKLRQIADKLQRGIGYDYDDAVRKCQKLRRKKLRNADVGEEAMVLAVKRGFEQAQAKANKPSSPGQNDDEENDLGYIVDYKRYNADVFTGVNRRTAAVFQFHSAALRRLNKVGCQRYEGDYTRLKQKHAERRARRMAG